MLVPDRPEGRQDLAGLGDPRGLWLGLQKEPIQPPLTPTPLPLGYPLPTSCLAAMNPMVMT